MSPKAQDAPRLPVLLILPAIDWNSRTDEEATARELKQHHGRRQVSGEAQRPWGHSSASEPPHGTAKPAALPQGSTPRGPAHPSSPEMASLRPCG